METFDFGEAVKQLKKGNLVCRKGWNGKGMFVVKQIPQTVNADVIPTMNSLPAAAKKEILSRENGSISYTNQCLLVQPDGRADSWLASSSDIFAEDWMLYNAD